MVRCILLSALALLVSCGTPVTPGAGGTPPGTPTPISPRPATPVPATPTGASFAPIVTLACGGATRSARFFTVTWTTERGTIHGDGALILSQMETLAVPAGATLTFTASGMSRPTYAAVRMHGVASGNIQWGSPYPVSLPARVTEQGATTDASFTSGEYLVLIDLLWGVNQASYGFRVAIAP